MKLRNKKTGEIRNAIDIDMYTNSVYLKVSDGEFDNETIEYRSLAELNEEWEDVPKEAVQVYIEGIQEVHSGGGRVFIDYATAKEAELAVRKLKAWKRLKDKGFEFLPEASFIQRKTDEGESLGAISFRMDDENDFIWGDNEDLKILFGGEE